jgi:hypothetical protein
MATFAETGIVLKANPAAAREALCLPQDHSLPFIRLHPRTNLCEWSRAGDAVQASAFCAQAKRWAEVEHSRYAGVLFDTASFMEMRKMKTVIAAFGFCLAVAPAYALKPCEELKSEIATKLDAKGVKNYQLEIVANADVKDQNVVGTCEGGTKKITYKKGDQAPESGAAPAGRGAKPPATPPGR